MSTTIVPALEPDSAVYPVGPEACLGECGTITFTRDIARHLTHLLDVPVTDLLHRENPWDRRDCAKAWTSEYTIGGRGVIVTAFEATAPLLAYPFMQYAITIDAQSRLFERPSQHQPLEWQLARAIAIDLTTS